jgi:CRISPR-associated exonuclease Cas4
MSSEKYYSEEDYLELSGLQHFLFCRRQWALIHIEKQWRDNLLTTEGVMMHDRVHDEKQIELRGKILVTRGIRVSSGSLGVSGQCDVVEFHRDKCGISLFGREGKWKAYPIEYKRGTSKQNQCDKAQLCAEAMCLEEMLCTRIDSGVLFYGENRRRQEVVFDETLRKLVINTLGEMHELYRRGYTPRVRQQKGCKSCSLRDLCLPELMTTQSVESYLRGKLCENC